MVLLSLLSLLLIVLLSARRPDTYVIHIKFTIVGVYYDSTNNNDTNTNNDNNV